MGIVEDGGLRLRREVAALVHARYAPQIASASIGRRVVLWFRMRKDIYEELNRMNSDQALF